jgi:hypothetical protein
MRESHLRIVKFSNYPQALLSAACITFKNKIMTFELKTNSMLHPGSE